MLLVTVATERIPAVNEWECSARRQGFQTKILGEGLVWNGYSTYQRLLRDFFAEYQGPSTELVAKVDCYDLLVVGSPAELEAKYRAYNVGIVAGGEKLCAQNCFQHTQAVNNDTYKWVNGGMVMGTVSDMYTLYTWCYDNFQDDDQVAIGMYTEMFPSHVAIDGKQSMVANFYSLKEIEWDGTRYRHTLTGEYPVFLHTPFIAKDLGRRNEAIRTCLVENYTSSSTISYAVDLGRHIVKHATTNSVYGPLVVAGVVLLALGLILLASAIVMLSNRRRQTFTNF